MKKNDYSKQIALALILIVGAGLLYMLWAYFTAIVSALIFAYLFSPLYLQMLKTVKRRGLAALLTLLTFMIMALIPVLSLFAIALNQASNFVSDFQVENYTAIIRKLIPMRVDLNQVLLNWAADLVSRLQSATPSILFSASHFFASLFIMFFLMYYIFINLHVFIARMVEVLPFSQENSIRLINEFENMSRAIIMGQLLVAVSQGVTGGLGFLIFGINGAVLWGFVMTILSFIPLLGAFLVWLPAGIVQIIQHHYFSGIGILLWGIIVVSNIDNLLRPRLMERSANINPVVTLLGVFIGIEFFGLIGIVVGPLVLALYLILVQMFREEYLENEAAPSDVPPPIEVTPSNPSLEPEPDVRQQ